MKSVLALIGVVLGFSTIASASAGVFCNPQNQIVQWVCNETPQGQGWVAQPGNCFHRNTLRSCTGDDNGGGPGNGGGGHGGGPGNGGGGQFIDLRNAMFTVYGRYEIFFADRNSAYCQFSSQRDADRFRYINGIRRIEQVNSIPYSLRYVGICRVN